MLTPILYLSFIQWGTAAPGILVSGRMVMQATP